MSRIVQTRSAIAEKIEEIMPDDVSVFTHGGQFDLDQVKRYSAKAPAIIVACLRMGSIEIQGGERVADLRWVAMILERNRDNDRRGVLALAKLELLTHLIAENRWGLDFTTAPATGFNAANLFSGAVDAKGLAMWAVVWDQKIDLVGTFADSLADFKTLVTDYDLDTTDGISDDATDIVSLPT
jgi:hypothetical protein